MNCAAICLALGLTLTSSQQLGFDSPYLGAVASIEARSSEYIGMIDLEWQNAAKLDTGDGHGQNLQVLVGIEQGKLDILVGGSASIIQTSKYEKSAVAPLVELGYRFNPMRVAVFYSESQDKRVGKVYGARASTNTRLKVELKYEHVEYESFFWVPHTGDIVRVSYKWVF